MSWHAIDSVDEAINETRSFLTPVQLWTWLKLAVISIFVSVGGSYGFSSLNVLTTAPSTPSPPPGDASQPSLTAVTEALSMSEITIIVAIVGILIALSLTYSLLTELFRFVFYDALRTDRVALLSPAAQRFGQAIRLFGFKIGLQVLAVAPFVVGALAVWYYRPDLAVSETMVGIGGLLVVVAAAVIGLSYIAIMRGTDEFVVPIMVLTDSGVIDGWRRFWPVFRGQLSQFGVYIVVHFLLLLAIGIGSSIVGALIFGIVFTIGAVVGLVLVFGIFGGLGAVTASSPALVLLGLVVLLTLLVGYVLFLPVQIVILSYVVTYEVSVLAAADEELRLRPSQAPSADTPETADSAV